MIELFQFLERNKADIVAELNERVPATVPAYAQVPRSELGPWHEHLLEAFGDYLVTGDPETMGGALRYITKVRAQQGFELSDLLRALLILSPVLREHLQAERPDRFDAGARGGYDDALERLEQTTHDAACLLADVFHDHLRNTVNEHEDYLKRTHPKYGVDLSKFILFKG